jgi:hypothetical protein
MMTQHAFQMRLECRYQRPDNSVAQLRVQNFEKGAWTEFELGFAQPGFLIFVYAILNCQHLYMRSNAAERGLLLDAARGSIEVVANRDWVVQRLQVRFEGQLQSGTPAPGDVDHIIDRMQHCPVSINLKEVADSRTLVEFSPVP